MLVENIADQHIAAHDIVVWRFWRMGLAALENNFRATQYLIL